MRLRRAGGALAREGTVICEKCIARAHWRRRVTRGRRRGSGARQRRDQRHPRQATRRKREVSEGSITDEWSCPQITRVAFLGCTEYVRSV